MAQYIKNANIFGRIGTGFGKGLAEQIPKEVERNRLSSALQDVGNQQGKSQFQRFAGLVGAAHEYPQVVQSGERLLTQEAQNQALSQGVSGKNQSNSFPKINQIPTDPNAPQKPQSITTKEPVKATIENYIPKSYQDILNRGSELYNANPALYKNDSNNAIAAAQQEDQQNQAINQAQQQQRKGQQDVQSTVQSELKSLAQRAGGQIPDSLYNEIENKALEAVKSGDKTELEAAKSGREEIDKISRDVADIKSWGDMTLINNNPKSILTSMENVRKSFKDLGYTREYADLLIAENGHSPTFAYAAANPVREQPYLNNYLKNLPSIKPELKKVPGVPGLAGVGLSRQKGKNSEKETLKISSDLAKSMGKEGSPLAVAYELEKKGYDPQIWKDYLTRNTKQLDLTAGQIAELQKTDKSFTSWLTDWWLRSFSGLE